MYMGLGLIFENIYINICINFGMHTYILYVMCIIDYMYIYVLCICTNLCGYKTDSQ